LADRQTAPGAPIVARGVVQINLPGATARGAAIHPRGAAMSLSIGLFLAWSTRRE
jgi:hypothetical protein